MLNFKAVICKLFKNIFYCSDFLYHYYSHINFLDLSKSSIKKNQIQVLFYYNFQNLKDCSDWFIFIIPVRKSRKERSCLHEQFPFKMNIVLVINRVSKT